MRPSGRSAGTCRRFCARSVFATSKANCHASSDLDLRRGTDFSARRVRPNCIRSVKSWWGPRHAVATPGDLLFHIRARRMDLVRACQPDYDASRGRASPVDEVHGFSISTIAIWSVLWTERRTRGARLQSMPRLSAQEDAAFAGGSYVIVQKYLHDLAGWNATVHRGSGAHHRPHQACPTSNWTTRSSRLGAQCAHYNRGDGKEVKIVRDNMPFGRRAKGSSGPSSLVTRVRPAPSSRCW